jgi:hypothetical protein
MWSVIEWRYDKKGRNYTLKRFQFNNYDIAFTKLRLLNDDGVAIAALVKVL